MACSGQQNPTASIHCMLLLKNSACQREKGLSHSPSSEHCCALGPVYANRKITDHYVNIISTEENGTASTDFTGDIRSMRSVYDTLKLIVKVNFLGRVQKQYG